MVALAQSSEEGQESASDVLARGAGTTIIEGGTGSPNFTPVLTKVAFHAEKNGGVVSGDFECLALSPPVGTGAGSGSFTVNAMYVTGTISSAVVNDHTVKIHSQAGAVDVFAAEERRARLLRCNEWMRQSVERFEMKTATNGRQRAL